MNISEKTKEDLINEVADLKKQIKNLNAIIDQQKEDEHHAESREDKYKTILDNMEEFYFEVDLAGNFTFFNDQICKVFGYSRDELMGMNNRSYTTNEIALQMFRDFNEVFRTGKPFKITDYSIVTKDGTAKNLEISASLKKNKNGNLIGFCGIGRDITDRKQKEMERALLIDQLQQSQRLEAIATLAGGVAHDFNNILMGMQGNISLILLKVDTDTLTFKRLKKVEELIERGAHLIQQLLGFAKTKTNAANPLNINNVIENTSYFFSRSKKNIAVHTELEKNIWPVDIGQGAVEQVLLSLYMNADQAMPQGGELFIKTRNVFLDDAFVNPYNLTPGRYINISIKDTGIGMDMATQKRIFDPFFTTKDLGQGNGLGLASVFGIVRNHGGMIKVESEKGKGAAFNIFLSAYPDENETSYAYFSGKTSIDLNTILLVNDDELMIDVCESLLTELGYRVISVRSINDAYEKFVQNVKKIKIVMIDITLPDMTGDDVLIRFKKINPLVPVLLIDGYREGDTHQISEKKVYIIQKPFSLGQLSEKIRKIMKEEPQERASF
ncbi:MAG: PAS domain S-box protein [Proteobacteria bacterium]|nr:PAS domain S-box protein [Pseudomonadota bacterium]